MGKSDKRSSSAKKGWAKRKKREERQQKREEEKRKGKEAATSSDSSSSLTEKPKLNLCVDMVLEAAEAELVSLGGKLPPLDPSESLSSFSVGDIGAVFREHAQTLWSLLSRLMDKTGNIQKNNDQRDFLLTLWWLNSETPETTGSLYSLAYS